MRSLIAAGGFLAIAVSAAVSLGREPGEDALARAIAPFVDGQTLAIAHADLAALDAQQAVDSLCRFFHLSRRQRDAILALIVPLNVVADGMPDGARADLFVVTSVSDFVTLPFFFVMPLEENSPANVISLEIRRALAENLSLEITTERIGDALVTGSPQTLARLKKAPAAKRPEIAAAFRVVGDRQAQLLLVPPAPARRIIEILMPSLPAQYGGGPTKRFTGNVEWLAVGLDFHGQTTDVELIAQTESVPAATALAGDLITVFESLASSEIGGAIPEFEILAARLAPKVSGDRLMWQLSTDRGELADLGSMLLPVLSSAGKLFAERPAK